MNLADLQNEINASLKKGDKLCVQTLRFLVSAIKNSAIAKYGAEAESKLTEADILEAVKKLVKTHQESIEAYTKANRLDLADQEKAELQILETYLPAQLSDAQLQEILKPIVASGESNFGLLMKQAIAAVKGQVDGGRVSAMLKNLLVK